MKKYLLVYLLCCFPCIAGTIKAQIQVGDTVQFWSVSYIDWPPLWGQPQHIINAVCQRVGQHCYIFVEDQAPMPAQWSMDTIVSWFDEQFVPKLTPKYGPVPDALDNDPRVFILWHNENNWGGYFDPGQQMSDSMVTATWNRHSSEKEIIYLAAGGNFIYPGTVAHEFGHLLHWGKDHSPEPPANPVKYWEDAWVDEGFSTFAALCLTEGDIYQHSVPTTPFFNSGQGHDIPLIWFSSYNQVKLFMLFMFEHFGQWDYIAALIGNQLNGIPGVEAALDSLGYSESFDDAFEQWVIADFIDDSVYAGGKYSYIHYDFNGSPVITSSHATFPTGWKTKTLTAYGADYITFNATVPTPLTIEFKGDSSSKFRLAFIMEQTAGGPTKNVVPVALNAQNQAIFTVDSLGIDFNRLVMVVMNVDSTIHEGETVSYSYSASGFSGMEEAVNRALLVYPNPFSDKLGLTVLQSMLLPYTIQIINGQGQEILTGALNAINTSFDFSAFPAGIYYLRLISGEKTYSRKLIKI